MKLLSENCNEESACKAVTMVLKYLKKILVEIKFQSTKFRGISFPSKRYKNSTTRYNLNSKGGDIYFCTMLNHVHSRKPVSFHRP